MRTESWKYYSLVSGLALLWLNVPLRVWWLGLLALALWGVPQTLLMGEILKRAWGARGFSQWIEARLAGAFLLSFVAAIFIHVYKLGHLQVAAVFTLTTAVTIAGLWATRKLPPHPLHGAQDAARSNLRISGDWISVCGTLTFAALWGAGIVMLWMSRTGAPIWSPWQAIPLRYLAVWTGAGAILLGLILSYSREQTSSRRYSGLLLALIIFFSLLTHAYLPVVYDTGFSGDKWRHLGVERLLLEGRAHPPVLLGEETVSARVGPFEVPEVFTIANKYPYANLWGLTVALASALAIDPFWIDLLLVPLLFSALVPFFLWRLGRMLFERELSALLLAFAPALFFSFQWAGGVTLPVSFGFIFFLWLITLAVHHVEFFRDSGEPHGPTVRAQHGFLWIAALFGFLGYTLYALIFAVLVAGVKTTRALWYPRGWEEKIHPYIARAFLVTTAQVRRVRKEAIAFLALAGMFFLPVVDAGFGGSVWREWSFHAFLGWIADGFGRISGIDASVSGLIAGAGPGNLLYYGAPAVRAVSRVFTKFELPALLTLAVFLVIFIGALQGASLWRSVWLRRAMWVSFAVLFGNYAIGWFAMDGGHLFVRRMDLVFMIPVAALLTAGLSTLILQRPRLGVVRASAIVFGMVLFGSATYASGPVLDRVTRDEARAAEIVWSILQDANIQYPISNSQPYCVLANTWPLLAVEAYSARRIVGGGFPMADEYTQPERVELFKAMSAHPSREVLERSREVTGARVCIYMTEARFLVPGAHEKTVAMLGEPLRIGKVMVWRFP